MPVALLRANLTELFRMMFMQRMLEQHTGHAIYDMKIGGTLIWGAGQAVIHENQQR